MNEKSPLLFCNFLRFPDYIFQSTRKFFVELSLKEELMHEINLYKCQDYQIRNHSTIHLYFSKTGEGKETIGHLIKHINSIGQIQWIFGSDKKDPS